MKLYFRVTAAVSIFYFILMLSMFDIFSSIYRLENEVVKTDSKNRIIFMITLFVSILLHAIYLIFYPKIKEKYNLLSKISLVYFIPYSVLINLFSMAYVVLFLINIPYLNIKENYTLVYPQSTEKGENNLKELSLMVKNIKDEIKINEIPERDKLKNIDEEKLLKLKEILKSMDGVYKFIEENELTQKVTLNYSDTFFADYMRIQSYELYIMEKEFADSDIKENSEKYINLFKIYEKILNQKSKSYVAHMILNAVISRHIDFYFNNSERLSLEVLEKIDFNSLEKSLKDSYEQATAHEFYSMNSIIENLKEPFTAKPLINITLMKKVTEQNFLETIKNYDTILSEAKFENRKNLGKNIFIAPVANILYQISSPERKSSLIKPLTTKTKLHLLKYVVEKKGDINTEGMPSSFIDGKKIELEYKEGKYIINSSYDLTGKTEKIIEYRCRFVK